MKKEKISVVIPCNNEESSLPFFYKELNKVSKSMKKLDFEFIFIDDGSKDNTLSIIKEFRKKDKRVRYLSFSRNFGKEAAMYAGLSVATGDYISVMDADMQDPPVMLKEMFKAIKEEGYDVCGLISKKHPDYSLCRKIFTKIWYIISNRLIDTPEGARDFRLMKKEVVDSVLSLKEYNRYSKAIFNYVGYNTKWISYVPPKRYAGKSKWSFWKLFKYAVEAIVSFSTTPLIISIFIGILFLLVSLIGIIYFIINNLVIGGSNSLFLIIIFLIMFMGGMQLFFFGIMGMYLSKTYEEVKNRPLYIVRESEEM